MFAFFNDVVVFAFVAAADEVVLVVVVIVLVAVEVAAFFALLVFCDGLLLAAGKFWCLTVVLAARFSPVQKFAN